jgi:hypothetical protein
MIDNTTCLEASLDYAERMVRKGFGTPEQAAQVCGISLADLHARLAEPPRPEGPPTANWRRFLS